MEATAAKQQTEGNSEQERISRFQAVARRLMGPEFKLSLREIATAIGCSEEKMPSYISEDRRAVPPVDYLERLETYELKQARIRRFQAVARRLMSPEFRLSLREIATVIGSSEEKLSSYISDDRRAVPPPDCVEKIEAHELEQERIRRFQAVARRLLGSEFNRSQKDIAGEVGCSEEKMSRYMSQERRSIPPQDQVDKIEDYELRLRSEQAERHSVRWSIRNHNVSGTEKQLMARHFAQKEFLKGDNGVASILVASGTTTQRVVEESIKVVDAGANAWLTWYTPSTLVSDHLREFRRKYQHLQKAAQLFVFPGLIDVELESVVGPEAEEFAEGYKRAFRYAILSCHRFDMRTGSIRFLHPSELRLQKACALRTATKKYLFLDPGKFADEEQPTYDVRNLLETSTSVTIYTVSSHLDDELKSGFLRLRRSILESGRGTDLESRALRLCIVDRDNFEKATILPEGGAD